MGNKIFNSLRGFLLGGFCPTRWSVLQMCLGLLLFPGCALLEQPSNPTVPAETRTQPAIPPVSGQTPPSQLVPAQPTGKPANTAPVKLPQTGQASWYGANHQGKQTASGSTFDQAALTAAHPSLPFGSKIKVTNLTNGKSVEVEITDRGPSSGNRIIDLSQAAAKALEMVDSGTATVRIELP
jgi:rare lipoprotein A